MNTLLLVVDFDGTVYRGDGPVRAYAARIAATLPPEAAERYLALFACYLAEGVAAAEDLADPAAAAALRASVDHWGAAAALAEEVFGVAPDAVAAAFAGARQDMLDPACEIEVVTPLLETLAELRGAARVVLATNSPHPGLGPLLGRLGVAGAFDAVVADAGKPAGMRALLRRELGGYADVEPWRAFSLGDHYRNEIAPAVEIGAATGYIDRFGRADGPATATAPVAERLLPVIHAWAADPESTARPSG
ncbi:HAD family hydrolase [Actinospica durhamensis]|uniref:HAD family hydrolase n=1 Tax=Actinospica durhamensis TaxID=1508375 RepID=A0A941EM42_9ACTN|nr:HAD family hydrolase [Actinospica durhamensis]MBR7833646.1 HAD family hydrolase [Actinospica durhamensis]